jgi:polar amino acid transport system substrate-binding protein
MRQSSRFSPLRRLVVAAGFLLPLGMIAAPADAQPVDGIVKKGKLTVGMLVDFPPFGITNAESNPDGYDADVARLMAKHMGTQLEIVPVTGPNRIPYLLTNKVDLLVASLGVTPERAKQVQFSEPYASIDIGLLAPKKAAIKTADDLKTMRVAVARASTQDTALTEVAPKTAKIMRFDDDASAVQALLSNQVDAIGLSNVVARELEKMAPGQYEMKFVLRRQPNAVALRKDQDELLAWVNKFIETIKANGELNAIHQKWLGSDLPELPKDDLPKS